METPKTVGYKAICWKRREERKGRSKGRREGKEKRMQVTSCYFDSINELESGNLLCKQLLSGSSISSSERPLPVPIKHCPTPLPAAFLLLTTTEQAWLARGQWLMPVTLPYLGG
jgi:hypothetical protein